MEHLEKFLPWFIGISGATVGALSSIYALWEKYRKRRSDESVEQRQAKREETDETIRRLYLYIDRVEKEHNDDRANLSKLHEDYVLTREELSRARERCAYLEKETERLRGVGKL